jgi:hypothetical protein
MQTLSVFVTNTQVEEIGQHREVVCLPKQYVSGFLFGITAGRIKDPKLRAKIIQFQEEAHLILDAAFTGDTDLEIRKMTCYVRMAGNFPTYTTQTPNTQVNNKLAAVRYSSTSDNPAERPTRSKLAWDF